MVATATQDYNGVMDPSLPGAELIECGLIDLHDGRETVEAAVRKSGGTSQGWRAGRRHLFALFREKR